MNGQNNFYNNSGTFKPPRDYYMSNKKEGLFTQSLRSLEIQLKTLFYGSGNENSLEFLDSLSNLGIAEQEILLKYFTSVIDRILQGDKRYFTESDTEQKKIEDDLYSEIVSGMNAAAKIPLLDGKRLEVLEGGKNSKKNKVLIDLSSARKSRKNQSKPVLN
jgi:hypothetical protein